jgi:alkylation response protein AidB-like acyl-CoA dehydrogenase
VPHYKAPADDYAFLLHEFLRVHERADLPGFSELTPELTSQVLDAAGHFYEDVLHPINLSGDTEGAVLEQGRVRTPAGFREAWQRYKDAGWHRMTLPESMGGSGLPPLMAVPMDEMGMASGHSLMMYGGFCASTSHMLSHLGEDWMRQHVVPRLVAGDWTATMCLTEPHCGTDLRQLRTRAERQADGSWRLHGTKIFISGGDHDLTDNIVHIVLAKVPDENGRLGPGLESVHVFLVSSHEIDTASGALGPRGGVQVLSLEHKMGIAASATCVLQFEGARAWRIAGRGAGTSANMAAMFMMMNHARVATAISGVSYAEIAHQNAGAYARERLSGRAATGPRQPDSPADPIVVHPDIRRLLLHSQAFAEGARAMGLRAAFWQSVAAHSHDEQERVWAHDLVEVLTPVMKAYFTDKGFESAVACQQVLGGHGYVRDHGLEQFVRNARIGQIYEGANGIQAIDLVSRKLMAHGGRAADSFEQAIERSIHALHAHPQAAQLQDIAQALQSGLGTLQAARQALLSQHGDPNAAGAAAYDLLTLYGILGVGWAWADLSACVLAPGVLQRIGAAQQQRKLGLARLWMSREMPWLQALHLRIAAGSSSLMALPDEAV